MSESYLQWMWTVTMRSWLDGRWDVVPMGRWTITMKYVDGKMDCHDEMCRWEDMDCSEVGGKMDCHGRCSKTAWHDITAIFAPAFVHQRCSPAVAAAGKAASQCMQTVTRFYFFPGTWRVIDEGACRAGKRLISLHASRARSLARETSMRSWWLEEDAVSFVHDEDDAMTWSTDCQLKITPILSRGIVWKKPLATLRY